MPAGVWPPRSCRASRSWRSSTSPSAGCRRTAASGSRCAGRRSISASRPCRRCTARPSCCAFSTAPRWRSTTPSSASPPTVIERMQALRSTLPNGIVLVTGPTGSGKTTTLYTGLLRSSIRLDRKIITVEDPIEYQLPASPDAGQAADRADLRAVAARHPAPGSRRHHGRRDPRPGDRADRRAGGADRPSRAVDAAHQLGRRGGDAAARHGPGGLSCSPRCCAACWRSAWCAGCARPAAAPRRRRRTDPPASTSPRAATAPSRRCVMPSAAPSAATPAIAAASPSPSSCTLNPEIEQLVFTRADHNSIERAAVAAGMTTMFSAGWTPRWPARRRSRKWCAASARKTEPWRHSAIARSRRPATSDRYDGRGAASEVIARCSARATFRCAPTRPAEAPGLARCCMPNSPARPEPEATGTGNIMRELATMLAAGQDLDRALRYLHETAPNARVRTVVGRTA